MAESLRTSLRTKALAFLARRDYSRAALARKLAPFSESEAMLNCLLDELVAGKLLSDTRYATGRARVRGLRYGDACLTHELGQEGLSSEDISAAIVEAGDESNRCRQVWQKKFGALPGTLAERARQVRFLRHRGFSSASIQGVLNGVLSNDPELDDVS